MKRSHSRERTIAILPDRWEPPSPPRICKRFILKERAVTVSFQSTRPRLIHWKGLTTLHSHGNL